MDLSNLPKLVEAFNKLPMPPKDTFGSVNHWQFTINQDPVDVSKDALFLINPNNMNCDWPDSDGRLYLTAAEDRANLVLPLLLNAFVKGLGFSLDLRSFAPWTWGTGDVELAKALERQLKAVGVRKELCEVKTGDKLGIEIGQLEWNRTVNMLRTFGHPPEGCCYNCKKPAATGKKLQVCGGCKDADYCSKDCHRHHWKYHKSLCKHKQAEAKLRPLEWYQQKAPDSSEAPSLAKEVNLNLLHVDSKAGISLPIRRLVMTGKDTKENMIKLFGPNTFPEIQETWEREHLDVLIKPDFYSTAAIRSAPLDKGCPAMTSRPTTEKEQAMVERVREMQQMISSYMGPRNPIAPVDLKEADFLIDLILGKYGTAWTAIAEVAVWSTMIVVDLNSEQRRELRAWGIK